MGEDRFGPRLVLLIDDEDDIRDSVAELLRFEGYEVQTAADGGDALRFLATTALLPCVIVLDLMMPDVDGAAFRARQLADPRLASIPVVIMSAAEDVRGAAAALGVRDYLVKPVELTALVERIARYCAS